MVRSVRSSESGCPALSCARRVNRGGRRAFVKHVNNPQRARYPASRFIDSQRVRTRQIHEEDPVSSARRLLKREAIDNGDLARSADRSGRRVIGERNLSELDHSTGLFDTNRVGLTERLQDHGPA